MFLAVTDVLADLSSVPESIPDDYMSRIERFVVLLYSRTSNANAVRQALNAQPCATVDDIAKMINCFRSFGEYSVKV